MYRYRCPRCKKRVEFKALYDGRFLIGCTSCHIHRIMPAGEGGDDAYLQFLEDYDRDLINENIHFETLLEKEGIVRSEEATKKMVSEAGGGFNELPNPFRTAILSHQDYLVLYRLIKAQEPEYGGEIDVLDVDDILCKALKQSGINKLYAFQIQAIGRILSGEDVAIVAPTGSGKTEAFSIPIVQSVAEKRRRSGYPMIGKQGVKALFIYPTKALGRDQLPKLRKMGDSLGISIKVFDGDTSQAERRRILGNPPEIVITNFDTLHYHFMHRTHFSQLLTGVEQMVVDEVHVYKGTFGSNVHFILRRLQRLTGGFQVVVSSATISNPQEFCEALFARRFTIVSEGEGRHGRIHFALLFPTLRSHRALVVDILKNLTTSNYRPIVFSSTHLGAELTAFYGRKNGVDVEVHRAGLLPSHRKRVEETFREGILKAVSATPTLELGIDIGDVDAIISDLVPVTRLIQRTGRAARRGQEGLAFLALRDNDPISQYYKNNPHHYFEDIEPGYIDPSNPVVAEIQILAAAMDRSIQKGEFANYSRELNNLISKGLLREYQDRLVPNFREAERILRKHDIRGCGKAVTIRLGNRKIGERSLPQALDELHPGAVYFLAGIRYRSLDLTVRENGGMAEVEKLPVNYPYYTKSLVEEWPTILSELEKRNVLGIEVLRCDLAVEKRVIGYINIEFGCEVTRGQKVLLKDPVEYKFYTKGFVFKAPTPRALTITPESELVASGFHATEHVTIEGSNMLTGGAGADMGGISLGSSGLIFIYDGSPGGNGATKILFDRLEEVFKRGFKILTECPCTSESGCPRCTFSYRCGNNNEYLHKSGAAEILTRILNGETTTIIEPILGEKSYA